MSTDVGVKPLTPHSSTFPFGEGGILCDPGDGAIVRISHPRHPDMNFLLGDPEQAWHHSPFYWGKGFLVTSLGAGRWDHPERLTLRPDGYDLFFRPMPGLDLAVARRVGHVCRETYSLRNVGSAPVRIGSWGISTPFRDVYPNARECLASACHAHLWPGGERAYVWAIRMNGQGPGLGLAVEQGALWSYSIETRNIKTGSNARGHIYLHVTDAARSPGALGG